VGGAIATGLAWGAAYAIGREIWDDIDWNRGDINIDVDRNIDIDRNVNVDRKSWQWALRALNMLEAAEVDRAPITIGGAHRIGGSCGLMPYRLRRSPGCRPLDITLSLRSLTGRGLVRQRQT
jgi:hypothetical protein